MDELSQGSSEDMEVAPVVDENVVPDEQESVKAEDSEGHDNKSDPLYVQKRLKQQKRAHDREMRELQARMADMQSHLSSNQPTSDMSPYAQGLQNPNGMDETISKAVSFALSQRDEQERKAKAAEAGSNLSKHYDLLQDHLDSMSDKYDDFYEIVRGNHVPITPTMRDAAIMLPKKGAGSAGEVLYKLGKNPEELKRISKLYPHEQASELVALSHALISGGEHKNSNSKHLGQVKNNPITNSAGITDKTSPAQIRALMKAGKFK